MLSRLYVDNYKCLVNVDIKLGHLQLLLGPNGSGKSTVFEVLHNVVRYVGGGLTTDVFPNSSLTRWQERRVQTFELEIQPSEGPAAGTTLKYRLEVDQAPDTKQNRAKLEQLTEDGKPLFESRMGEVQLYRDNHSAGPSLGLDWRRSALSTLGARPDNLKLTWFKEWANRATLIRIDPFNMSGTSDKEEQRPHVELSNYASWYRYLSLTSPGSVSQLHESLQKLMDGFSRLRLAQAGEGVYTLKAAFRGSGDAPGRASEYGFDELSHGQRALLGLYTLLHSAADSPDALLFIDEPDNFVSLAEIQPWLMACTDIFESSRTQLLLISHHPELIDQLARDYGIAFSRRDGGPTRTRRLEIEPDSALPISELVARGWENG